MEAVWGRGEASRPGYAGRPGGRGHVAGVRPPCGRRWVEQGGRVRVRERGIGGVGHAGERAEREAGRPSSAYPLSLFFNFFSQLFCQTHLDPFKILFRLCP